MSILFHLLGVLLDLLIQMLALGSAAAVVAMVVRSGPFADLPAALLFLALALVGLTLLVRRIWRRRRRIATARAGTAEVSTVTWLHFVLDVLWIAVGVWMVQGTQAPVWDDGSRAAAVAILVLGAGIGSLRLVALVRPANP